MVSCSAGSAFSAPSALISAAATLSAESIGEVIWLSLLLFFFFFFFFLFLEEVGSAATSPSTSASSGWASAVADS